MTIMEECHTLLFNLELLILHHKFKKSKKELKKEYRIL